MEHTPDLNDFDILFSYSFINDTKKFGAVYKHTP